MLNDVYLHTIINNRFHGLLSLVCSRLLAIVNALAPHFRIIVFKPFSITMNLVAKHAVICVSLFWTVGLFLKHKVSVPSPVGPLFSLTHRAECEAGLQLAGRSRQVRNATGRQRAWPAHGCGENIWVEVCEVKWAQSGCSCCAGNQCTRGSQSMTRNARVHYSCTLTLPGGYSGSETRV